MNIASYSVKPGDVIELRDAAQEHDPGAGSGRLAERDVPDYIEADHSKFSAKLARVPGLTDVPYAVQMEPNLVIEFYSR